MTRSAGHHRRLTARGWLLAVVVTLVGAALPAAGADASAVPRTPTVTVAPETGLRDGQRVAIEGAGWRPGYDVHVRECSADATRCLDLEGGDRVRDTGRFRLVARVSLLFQTADGDVVDCRTERCLLTAEDQGAPTVTASTPMEFDASATPRLAAEPSTGLVDGQTITVTGAHLAPDQTGFQLELCREAEDGGCYPSTAQAEVATDAAGAFSVELVVDATFYDQADCRVDACSLELTGPGPSGLARRAILPVAFRADGPLQYEPTLTVDPPGPYADGQAVTIVGAGWEPGAAVTLRHCEPQADPEAALVCPTTFPYPPPTADGSGAFRVDVVFRASVLRPDATRLDCRVDRCELAAISQHSVVRQPLSFDPYSPVAPTPTLTVTPNEDLLIGQLVQVTGAGFEPGRSYYLGQCSTARYLNPDSCPGDTVTADDEGHVHSSWIVRGAIARYHTDSYVCLGANRCFIDVADESWGALASAPLDVRPEGDEVISVAPRAGLDGDDQVTVDATGLNPGLTVDIAECKLRSPHWRSLCTSEQQVTVDATGTLHRTVLVHRTFTASRQPDRSVDCRHERCVLLVGGEGVTYQPGFGCCGNGHYHYRALPLSFTAGTSPGAPPAGVSESATTTSALPTTTWPTSTTSTTVHR